MQHWPIRFARPAPAVFRVAGERMTKRGQVHPDLVSAARFEITAQECMRGAFFYDFVASARKSSTGDDGHALAVFRMAPDRALQLAGIGLETSAGDREI